MIRFLIRWLARKEIAQAYDEGFALAAQIAKTREAIDQAIVAANKLPVAIDRAQSFAEGQLIGRQEMWDHLNDMVGERIGGCQDVITPEDLARARKGMVH